MIKEHGLLKTDTNEDLKSPDGLKTFDKNRYCLQLDTHKYKLPKQCLHYIGRFISVPMLLCLF